MSRHSFDEVVTNAEYIKKSDALLTDIKGYSINDWLNYGIIGWDDIIKTYFIQLDFNDDNDEMPWWIGKSFKEIPTFEFLCEILNKIFGIENGVFEFSNIIEKDTDQVKIEFVDI